MDPYLSCRVVSGSLLLWRSLLVRQYGCCSALWVCLAIGGLDIDTRTCGMCDMEAVVWDCCWLYPERL